jgi:hypothetical protein
MATPNAVALLGSRICAALGLCVASALFVAGFSQVYSLRRTFRWRAPDSVFTLVLFSFLSVWTQFVFVWRIFLDFSPQAYTFDDPGRACAAIGTLQPLLYIWAKQIMYLFLWQRSNIVMKALRVRERKVLLFSKVVALTIAAGVPVLFGWVFFVVFIGRIPATADNICEVVRLAAAGVLAHAAARLDAAADNDQPNPHHPVRRVRFVRQLCHAVPVRVPAAGAPQAHGRSRRGVRGKQLEAGQCDSSQRAFACIRAKAAARLTGSMGRLFCPRWRF